MNLGKAPDLVAGKVAGMASAFGIWRRVHRCVGSLGADDSVAFVVCAVAVVDVGGQGEHGGLLFFGGGICHFSVRVFRRVFGRRGWESCCNGAG